MSEDERKSMERWRLEILMFQSETAQRLEWMRILLSQLPDSPPNPWTEVHPFRQPL